MRAGISDEWHEPIDQSDEYIDRLIKSFHKGVKGKPLTEEQYRNLCETGYNTASCSELREMIYMMYHLQMCEENIQEVAIIYLLKNIMGSSSGSSRGTDE